jgi:outer membrane murein-binding lipoprotein Lpp
MARVLAGVLAVGLLIGGCSSGMSLEEYATAVEAEVRTMNAKLDALDASTGVGVDAVRAYATERAEARAAFLDAFGRLEPPESAADLHARALEVMTRVAAGERSLAAAAMASDSIRSVGELWATPEGLALRAVDDESVEICEAAQASFDERGGREFFEGALWVPSELRGAIDVAFGCRFEDR